ncbi:MAG: hypothetical protein R3E66_07555 [bacterium]
MFGPCYGDPQDGRPDKCDNYERPLWSYRYNVGDLFQPGGGGEQTWLIIVKNEMLGTWDPTNSVHNGCVSEDASQSRHVIMKEVLTGDMVMKANGDPRAYESLNPVTDGPGCWFVPRQRDATVQPEDDRTYRAVKNEFEDLPDHDEPRPHFQEVFDAQIKNGVLDKLANQAIFAIAMLDGYQMTPTAGNSNSTTPWITPRASPART